MRKRNLTGKFMDGKSYRSLRGLYSTRDLNRKHTELTENDHKLKSDHKDAEKNLREWNAQYRVVTEKNDAIVAQVISSFSIIKLHQFDLSLY